jgi:hypothetical protein
MRTICSACVASLVGGEREQPVQEESVKTRPVWGRRHQMPIAWLAIGWFASTTPMTFVS